MDMSSLPVEVIAAILSHVPLKVGRLVHKMFQTELGVDARGMWDVFWCAHQLMQAAASNCSCAEVATMWHQLSIVLKLQPASLFIGYPSRSSLLSMLLGPQQLHSALPPGSTHHTASPVRCVLQERLSTCALVCRTWATASAGASKVLTVQLRSQAQADNLAAWLTQYGSSIEHLSVATDRMAYEESLLQWQRQRMRRGDDGADVVVSQVEGSLVAQMLADYKVGDVRLSAAAAAVPVHADKGWCQKVKFDGAVAGC
jgi:hypothetical protein